MAKQKGRTRSPAQRRAYLAGLRRGKVLAAQALTRKRKAAALKGARVREERREILKEVRVRPLAPAVAVGELLLYEAPVEEGVPILSGLDFAEWVSPSAWQASVELWIEGKVVAASVVPVAAEWDQEAAAKAIRREVRSWYEEQVAGHSQWGESPVATLIRLSLQRT